MVTNIKQLDFSKRYTYADYLTWQLGEYVELIRGRIVRMSPAPGTAHQRVVMNLSNLIFNFLKDKSCEVFTAPFDVRLPLPPNRITTDKVDTVVQPDLCVICDPRKIDERGCKGAPDWIIEILSRSTAQKDTSEKFELYQNAGVKEYWIVHPNAGTILVYHLDKDDQYQLLRQQPFTGADSIAVSVLEDFHVDLGEVF